MTRRVLRRKKLVIPLTGYEWEQVRSIAPSRSAAAMQEWARGILLANLDSSAAGTLTALSAGSLDEVATQLAGAERAAIEEAMRVTDGNQTHAAERLGISRRSLIYKLERYGIKPTPVTRVVPKRTRRSRARRRVGDE